MSKVSEDKIKEYTDKLDQGLQTLVQGPEFANYLRTMAQFHNYSANNSLLIMIQKQDATQVASYTTWEKLGRNVKKGEKGIRIIAPSPYKTHRLRDRIDPDTGKTVIGADGKPIQENVEVIIPNFKIVTVFDITQTEGKELPEIVHELNGTKEDYDKMLTALQIFSPVPIEFERITNGANGFYSVSDKRIVIRDGMSETQSIKTICHEIAHSLIHSDAEQNRLSNSNTKEVEAESIAYVVCSHFGIDTSDYSFGYIAGWSKDKNIAELKESMSIIRSTSAKIINGVEQEMIHFRQKEEEMALAIEIDQFARDFDVYGYDDVVVCREAMIDSLVKDIHNGDVDYIEKWLNSAIQNSATEADAEMALYLKDKLSSYTKPKPPETISNPVSTIKPCKRK